VSVDLFITEPTGTCRLVLRRLRLADHEATGHFHDASVVIDQNAQATPDRPDGRKSVTDGRVPHDDPRWPKNCTECGEQFRNDDKWQVNEIDWHEGAGNRFAWGTGSWDGPPGAMIRTPWRDEPGRPPAWVVFLPNSTFWNTNDHSSRDGKLGGQWAVTGDAPRITVHPSINDQGSRPWHGWIRDGRFVNA
jgi:hypothetical protein